MGWGWGMGWALLAVASALRCPLCDVSGCRDVSCPSPYDACRVTTLTSLAGGAVLTRQDGGCDVIGPPDVIVTFRSHGELVTLREERCPQGGCGPSPTPAPSPDPPAPGPALSCVTCDTWDGSCGRPLAALRCPRPSDRCLDVITRLPGQVGEGRIRGCGSVGASCPRLVALETVSGRQVALRCCASSQCDPEEEAPSGLRCWSCEGPDPGGCAPRELRCSGGRTRCASGTARGPSGEPWLVRGCASPAWCEAPVGLGGAPWGGWVAQPHCCQGQLCNRLPGDPPSAAPRPPPPPFGLLLILSGLSLLLPHSAPHV